MTSNGGSALLGAAQWLEGLLLGPLAVTLAVLAVAATGLRMLSGRLPIRRGATVVMGCFLLFGAPAIARGLFGSATDMAASSEPPSQVLEAGPPPMPEPQPAKPQVTDPYAGASVAR